MKKEFFEVENPQYYNKPLIINSAGYALAMTPEFANAAKAVREKNNPNVIKYIDAYNNTDVVQTRETSKLKEDIILKRPGHPDKFVYQINSEKFDFEKDDKGNIDIYPRGRKGNQLYKIFTIPAPFLVDANGEKSSTQNVEMFLENNILTLIPDPNWLKSHQYPIILDPTVEINILNVHSHPQQGENWEVEFTTQGQADLYIIPNDQVTIDDDEFTGLYCGGQQVKPKILENDVIYYKNWHCNKVAKVVHYTKKAGNHTLRFEFGNKIVFAYNTTPNFSGDYKWAWGENIGWNNFQPTYGGVEVANAGLTGYVWAENVGWVKLDYDGDAGAVNTSSTDWGVTNDGDGNLDGYAWGENIGWVRFKTSYSQVVIDNSGNFSGYAWAENVGWIKFDHNQLGYIPQTTWSPNTAPTVSSSSDSPDPAPAGTYVTFSVDWADDDAGELAKIHICKTDAFNTSTLVCTGGSWCDSTSFTTDDPMTCPYATKYEDIASSPITYYAFVCDDNNACSATSTSAAFSVSAGITASSTVNVKGRMKVKGRVKIK